jgi:hypothetical protein
VFDTNIVIVGNVLTPPEWRHTTKTNTLVANFRVASTSRRFDKDNNRWVDGETLRVRVTCWRRLAENVGASIAAGDPVAALAGGGSEPFEKAAPESSGGAEVGGASGSGVVPGEVAGELAEIEMEVERLAAESAPRRSRRGTKREPVPA